jgi:phage protein U
MANWVLFQWGPIQFQVFPLNVGQYSHATGTDWAKKEIAGSAMYREWVGEGDEQITIKGKIFPHYFARKSRDRNIKTPIIGQEASMFGNLLRESSGGDFPSAGGLYHLDVIDNMRRQGQAHILMRGDGWHFGWFVIETLQRGHSLIAPDGVGQMIEFDASFQRVPIPNDGSETIGQAWQGGSVVETPTPDSESLPPPGDELVS